MLLNIGISVALAARRAMYPDDFELVSLISQNLQPSDHHFIIPVSLAKSIIDVHAAATRLGLKFVGGRAPRGMHYIRLPSSQRCESNLFGRAHFNAARYAIDFQEVHKWANSE